MNVREYLTSRGLFTLIALILIALIAISLVFLIVMTVPRMGPVMYQALTRQETYVVASSVLIVSTLTVIRVTVSDASLSVVDPRIRFER